MKLRNIVMTAMTVAIMSSCTQSQVSKDSKDMEWKRIEPSGLSDNPMVKLGEEWMLLSAGSEGDMNAMTIGWGTWGILWGRPVVTVYVSSSRYTYEFMERNEYFTVTGFPEEYKDALSYMGSHSGRDGDKLSESGLTPEFTELGNPIYEEANLAIECRLLYKEVFDRDQVPDNIKSMYDRGTGVHSMYIGEIVNIWIKE